MTDRPTDRPTDQQTDRQGHMEVTLSSNVFLLIYLHSAVRTSILCLFEVYLSYDPSCLSVGRLAGCRSVCRNV